MGAIYTTTVANVGTSDVLALAANFTRKSLMIQNLHATQTIKVKFGSAVVPSDVTQIQTLSFSAAATSGNLVLRWNGNNTAALVTTDNAAAVQTKIQAVTGLSSVTVAGDWTAGFVITMTGVTPQTFATDPKLTIQSSTLNVTPSIAVTTTGQYADGYFVAAANASLIFTGESCPLDAVHVLASGSNTRVQLIEGSG